MKLSFDVTQLAYFREVVTQCLGLQFEDTKNNELTAALLARMKANSCTNTETYLRVLTASFDEQRALASLLTVPETFFFRMPDHFRALKEVIFPELANAGRHEVRILSAGCASGEEAYSIAMLVSGSVAIPVRVASIHGVDINSAVVEKARQGRYSEWSLRETPTAMRRAYFSQTGRNFQVNENIRAMVTFEEGNLADPRATFWAKDSYDVIFIRNVLMYFSPASAKKVIERATEALVPGGFLFMGSAENLRGLSHDFHLCQTHGAFYYQRRKPGSKSSGSPTSDPASDLWAAPPPVPELKSDWLETIREATAKVENLTSITSRIRTSGGPQSKECTTPLPVKLPDVSAAMDLLRQERFSEALDELPVDAVQSVEAQLLRAVVLTNSGKLPEAEACCERLLRGDELNAGAHYVMALCREHAQDWTGVRSHDQAAIYLDPSFAMPHLHLALLARRTGDLDTARRELSQAMLLLEREDGSRILLFGGGFSRESLVELCRRELHACGGKP